MTGHLSPASRPHAATPSPIGHRMGPDDVHAPPDPATAAPGPAGASAAWWLSPVHPDFAATPAEAVATSAGADEAPPLDDVAALLDDSMADARSDGAGSCSFEIELPGLGHVAGRVSIRPGQAQVELHPSRPETARLLRGRRQELQGLLGRERHGDGDVSVSVSIVE